MDLKIFADVFMRHRAVIAVGVGIATLLSFWGLKQLGFDDNPRGVFRTSDEEFRLLEEVFDQFGADENDNFLVVQSDDLFSAAALRDLHRLVDELESVDGVEEVASLADDRLALLGVMPARDNIDSADLQQAKDAAINHPIIAGQLLSDDGSHALVTVRLRGDELSISEIRPVHEQLGDISSRFTEETALEVHMTGVPSIRVEAFDHVQNESRRFTVLCGITAFAMAIVILRRWQMVVVVVCAAVMSAIWAVGALGIVGEKITVLTVVLPMLVMVVAFTDSIHLAVDVRHSRVAGRLPRRSTRDAIRHLTVACGLTSFTTAVGFASLAVTQTEIIRRFGLACGMGAVIGFLAVITIVPLLSSTPLGNGMLPPRGGRRIDALANSLGNWLIDFVLRWRRAIVVGGVALFFLMAISALQLRPQNELNESLSDDSETIRTLNLVDEKFGGIFPAIVVVDWPENLQLSAPQVTAALADVHEVCERDSTVQHPFSVRNVTQAVGFVPPEVEGRLVRRDLRRAIVVSRSPARGLQYYSSRYPALAEKLRDLESKHAGFHFRLTGSSVVATRNLERMITDLASSLGIAMLVIFVTLTVVFRSIRIGLICLIPNTLPLLLTASILVWSGESLRFAGVIVFCVCLGIAVDDTIHVVTRFQRELREVGNVEEALRRSMRAVGSALLITTVVLMVGFSITLTSAIPGNRMFGALSCIAIASALIGDLVVLPAMLACFVKSPAKVIPSGD